MTEFGVQANILFGNIDHIQDTIFRHSHRPAPGPAGGPGKGPGLPAEHGLGS
ncbi:MAG: hypothetical protein ACOX37_06615 [Bacillota bacterium]